MPRNQVCPIQHGDFCNSELQVLRENQTYFLSPRTHVLKRKGTQISCNALVPLYHRVGETWLKVMPRPTATKDPITIQPHTKGDWKYVSPGELATTGIYTEQDLNL